MAESIVLQRGKRAGDILLVEALVSAGLSILSILTDSDISEFGSDFWMAVISAGISIALTFVLINPLKKDKIESIRTIYIILGALSLLGLYYSFRDDASDAVLFNMLDVAGYALIIIALFNFGRAGKNCCYVSAGITVFSAFLNLTNPEFAFSDLICPILFCVYYVFLGLYIESKGKDFKESTTKEEATETTNDEQPEHNGIKYDELIKLKELMDNGIITPAEYEAKKKQILDL